MNFSVFPHVHGNRPSQQMQLTRNTSHSSVVSSAVGTAHITSENCRPRVWVASVAWVEWRTELTQTTKRYIGTPERQVCAVMWAVPRVDDVACEFCPFTTSNGWVEGYYSAAHGELTAAIVNSEQRNSTSSSSALHQLHAPTELSWQMEWEKFEKLTHKQNLSTSHTSTTNVTAGVP